jgi:NADH-quinone oxidoreductase subunit M
MLWLYQRTMFGKVENPKNERLLDLNLREVATYVPLIILAFWIGIYPAPFINRVQPTVRQVVARVNGAYATGATASAADCAEGQTPAARAAAEASAGLPAGMLAAVPCEEPASAPPAAPAPHAPEVH